MSMMELSFSFRDFCSTKQQIEVEKTELLKGMYWQAPPGPMSVYLQLGETEISFIVEVYVVTYNLRCGSYAMRLSASFICDICI